MPSRLGPCSTRSTTSTGSSSWTGSPAPTRCTPARSTCSATCGQYPPGRAPLAQLAEALALKAGSSVGSSPTGGTSGTLRARMFVTLVDVTVHAPHRRTRREAMQSRNPVFNRSDAFSRRGYATFNDAPPASAAGLEEMYTAPSATGVQTGRMTMDDVVVKTGLMFAVLLPLAAVNFFLKDPLLTFGGAIAG